jgi:hypothetical protein
MKLNKRSPAKVTLFPLYHDSCLAAWVWRLTVLFRTRNLQEGPQVLSPNNQGTLKPQQESNSVSLECRYDLATTIMSI